MAPEYPFPVPINDYYSVVKYVIENTQEFRADGGRIALAGDSAGKIKMF
jgi:acetyl esterase